jgi:hypothetical protein
MLTKDKETSLSTSGGQPLTDLYRVFEGPLSVFRKYAESGTPADKLTQLSLSACSTESQLVNPSLLLLDGSSIAGTAILYHQDQKKTQPVIEKTPPNSSLGQTQALVRQVSRSSLVSLSSLQARLSRRSSSVIRHVHSVLSFSSTNSWRSSVSWRSSWISFGSQSSATPISSSTKVFDHPEDVSFNMRFRDTSHQLTVIELEESRYNPKSPIRFYSTRAYPYRERPRYLWIYDECSCGHRYRSHKLQESYRLCTDCGMQPVHQYFRELRGLEIPRNMLSKHIQMKDYFDNGLLYFAARYNSKTPGLLLRMIDMGADIHSKNTCGATFLHVLFQFLELDQILDSLPLLKRLSDLKFSFLSRDHWGHQPVHVLLERFPYSSIDLLDKLEAVFAVMKPDIDALNVDGHSGRMLMSRSSGRAKSKARLNEFVSRFPMSRNSAINFAVALSEMNGTTWMEWVSIESRWAWIDSDGETALIALLKYWDHDQDELLLPNIIKEMVGLGSQIEMRDRNGDTALAVATKRGLFLAVKCLIELQASIHTINSRGDGILRAARTEMRLAKKNGQDELYAMILNCIICLVDLEAYDFPSLRSELWAKWAPDPRGGWKSAYREEMIFDALSYAGVI